MTCLSVNVYVTDTDLILELGEYNILFFFSRILYLSGIFEFSKRDSQPETLKKTVQTF